MNYGNNNIYLRPDHECVHRSFDVVSRYLLALCGVRVGRTGVRVDHLRPERDVRTKLLLLMTLGLDRLLVLLILHGHDAGGSVTIVVVHDELIGGHPRVIRVRDTSTHLHLLFVLVVKLHLHANSEERHRLTTVKILSVHLRKVRGHRAFTISAPRIWNSLGLPDYLKDSELSIDIFNRYLKTYFFARY